MSTSARDRPTPAPDTLLSGLDGRRGQFHEASADGARVSCSRCGAGSADFFTTQGEAVCRVCYYAEQAEILDARAEESLAAELPKGVAPAKNPKPPKPGRVMWTGISLCVAGLAGAVLMFVLFGDIVKSLLLVAGFGFVTAARGYQVRHYQ